MKKIINILRQEILPLKTRLLEILDVRITPTPSFVSLTESVIPRIPNRRVLKFRDRHSCEKCGYINYGEYVRTRYVDQLNVLIKTCSRCDNEWIERCADGTPPNPEFEWEYVFE